MNNERQCFCNEQWLSKHSDIYVLATFHLSRRHDSSWHASLKPMGWWVYKARVSGKGVAAMSSWREPQSPAAQADTARMWGMIGNTAKCSTDKSTHPNHVNFIRSGPTFNWERKREGTCVWGRTGEQQDYCVVTRCMCVGVGEIGMERCKGGDGV